jgi:hypothetical protein
VLVDLTAATTMIIVTGTGQAALDALEDAGGPEIRRKCLLIPGFDVAWDECQCGQFAQSLIAEYLTSTPFDGGNAAIGNGCGSAYRVISVATSLVRCIPTMNERGEPPSCAKLLAAGIRDVQDRTAVRLGILCHLESLLESGDIEYFQIGQQTPLGEQGGCAGSVITWSVALRNSCPC